MANALDIKVHIDINVPVATTRTLTMFAIARCNETWRVPAILAIEPPEVGI